MGDPLSHDPLLQTSDFPQKPHYSKLITLPLPILHFCLILRVTSFGWVARSGHIFDSAPSPELAVPDRVSLMRS